MLTLKEVATELSQRLTRIFLKDDLVMVELKIPNRRIGVTWFSSMSFNGDTGLGASHQTGWTGLGKTDSAVGEYGSQDEADLQGNIFPDVLKPTSNIADITFW